jgi:hypothetical protein
MSLGALLAAGALAACGGGDEPRDSTDNVRSPLKDPERSGRSGTLEQTACSIVKPADVRKAVGLGSDYPLKARRSDSLDLSNCDWTGGPVTVARVTIDAAPSAELRYYNLFSEQLEFHNDEPARRPHQVRGVGADSAYGGAGAWWTRSRAQLIAFKGKRILRVRMVVKGFGNAQRRRAAIELARTTFSRLD